MTNDPRRFEERLDRIESDIRDMRSDLKALLTAHNMGKGFWFTAQVGGALVTAVAAIATFYHFVFGSGN